MRDAYQFNPARLHWTPFLHLFRSQILISRFGGRPRRICGFIGPFSIFNFSTAAPAAWHEIGVAGEPSWLTCFLVGEVRDYLPMS